MQGNDTKPRAAIVGLGGIAPSHMRALNALAQRVDVAAIVDTNPQRLEQFAEMNGIGAAYADLATMLATEHPDVVHLCTPPGIHLEQIRACLQAGAHVFCEKPLCASLAELDAICELERTTNRYVATVSQWRFGAAGQHFKQLVDSGKLGRPMVGFADTMWFRDDDYYARDAWRGTWKSEIGGSAITQGIHLADLFLWLMGRWHFVWATVGTLNHAIEIDDVSAALVQFESGAVGSVFNSVVSPRQESYVRWDFEHATVEVKALYRYTNQNWAFFAGPGAPAGTDSLWPPSVDEESTHAAQYAQVLDALARSEAPPVTTEGVRVVMEFISALYKSAATGQRVERGTIRPGDPFYEHMAGTYASG